MSFAEFTNMRSLLGGLARALNMINPDMEHHHEQTAYLAFATAREMGLTETDVNRVICAALLHDIGSIIIEEKVTILEIESYAEQIASIGANMLRDMPEFKDTADIISYCQSSWSSICERTGNNKNELDKAKLASIIHVADAATCLIPDKNVLNQVEGICNVIENGRGTEFFPEAVDAFQRLKKYELIWLDAMNNPNYFMYFTGEIHKVSLDKLIIFTKLMSRIIDYRSSFTAMHSAGVSAVALELAKRSGISS